MRNVKEPQTQTTTKPMNQFLQDQQWLPPLFSCCLRSSEKSVIKYRAEVITGKISAPYLEVSCLSSDCCCCCLVTKSCPTLLQPMHYSPPDSCVHGISKARILEWVAISSSRISSLPKIKPALAGEFFTTEPTRKHFIHRLDMFKSISSTLLKLDHLSHLSFSSGK